MGLAGWLGHSHIWVYGLEQALHCVEIRSHLLIFLSLSPLVRSFCGKQCLHCAKVLRLGVWICVLVSLWLGRNSHRRLHLGSKHPLHCVEILHQVNSILFSRLFLNFHGSASRTLHLGFKEFLHCIIVLRICLVCLFRHVSGLEVPHC